MAFATSKPYQAPRPVEYAQIPEPIFRKNWFGDTNLPGPNPKFSDLITARTKSKIFRFNHCHLHD